MGFTPKISKGWIQGIWCETTRFGATQDIWYDTKHNDATLDLTLSSSKQLSKRRGCRDHRDACNTPFGIGHLKSNSRAACTALGGMAALGWSSWPSQEVLCSCNFYPRVLDMTRLLPQGEF